MNPKQNHQNIKDKLQEAMTDKKDEHRDHKKEQMEDVAVPEKESETLEKLAAEVAHWKDLAMRTAAEMENLRKRTQIDMEKAARYANGSFAKDLLPVADCLEQAMVCAHQELDKEKKEGKEADPVVINLLKGIEMTHQNLMSALKKQQIEKMESLGKVFDPNLHKVIQEVDDAEKEAGTIVQELQAGYTIGGDRVLRDAMVIVSRK